RLHRGRQAVQVLEPADVAALQSRRLELLPEERHRRAPDPVELAQQPLLLQAAHLLEGHRLDRRVEVAALRIERAHACERRSTIASVKRGAAAASGISSSGTSSTSI